MLLGEELAEAALINSKSLRKCALECADLGHFGYATSLMVLSVEEAVKAVFSLFLSKNISLDPQIERTYLRSHHVRLRFGQGAFFILHMVQRDYSDVSDDLEPNDVPVAVEATLRKLMVMPENEINELKQASGAEWWLKANGLKQRGLYVDVECETLQSPRQITKSDFDQSEEMARRALVAARLARIISKRMPDYFRLLFGTIDIDTLASELEAEMHAELKT